LQIWKLYKNKIKKNRPYYKKTRKGDFFMADLNQAELQNLRHLIGAHETSYQKLNTYAGQTQDPQIKQMFTKSAQDALNTKQKLMNFSLINQVN
jgi:hypothetical protein